VKGQVSKVDWLRTAGGEKNLIIGINDEAVEFYKLK